MTVFMLYVAALCMNGFSIERQPNIQPEAVAVFADAFFAEKMAKSGVPGASLAIVHGKTTLYLKGYGLADSVKGIAVTPHKTAFRLGSISKTTIAIAILRLADRGLLDLDTPITNYIAPIQLPRGKGPEVTIRHLLTHRGGFDADMSFSALNREQALSSQSAAAVQRRLQRIRPAGGVAFYDVAGFGLLGIIVEHITGNPLEEAMKDLVFHPLGMQGAFAGLSPTQSSQLAACMEGFGPGRMTSRSHPRLARFARGSGSMAATAADMLALMRFLLDESPHQNSRLLSEQKFAAMMNFDQYRFHKNGPGLGLGIRQFHHQGITAIGHGGGITGFANQMELFPQYGVGIYVGIMGGPPQIYDARLSVLPALIEANAIPPDVSQALYDLENFPAAFAHKFLVPANQEEPRQQDHAAQVSKLASAGQDWSGYYVFGRFRSNNLLVNLSSLALSHRVTVNRAGHVFVSGSGPYEYRAPGWYQLAGKKRYLAFRKQGEQRYLAFGGDPYSVYIHHPAYAKPLFSLLPVPLCLLLLFSGTIYGLERFAAKLRRDGFFGACAALLWLSTAILELEFATLLLEVRGQWFLPGLWRTIFAATLLALAVLPCSLLSSILAPRRTAAGILVRIHRALLAFACLYLLLTSIFWLQF